MMTDTTDTSDEAVERLRTGLETNPMLYATLGSATLAALLARAKAAEEENAELNALFERIREADQRGIDRWRAEKPGRELVRPDMADATVWLLEQLERAEAERDEARGRADALLLDVAEREAERDAAQAEAAMWRTRAETAVGALPPMAAAEALTDDDFAWALRILAAKEPGHE
jgi:hypothetical protein